MRLAALCAVLLALAPGRARADDCTRACDHMRLVSERELALIGWFSPEEKQKIRVKSEVDEPARMARCVAGCREGRLDTKCVLAATETMDYVQCIKPKGARPAASPPAKPKGARPAASGITLAQRIGVPGLPRAARGFRGRPLPARERDEILEALAEASEGRRVSLVGEWLAESGAPMYGEDVARAGEALAQTADGPMATALIARHLSATLAQIGCARSFAEAARLEPPHQASHLARTCRLQRVVPILSTFSVLGVDLGRATLALVLELRARQAGFSFDPLHRRTLEILLSR